MQARVAPTEILVHRSQRGDRERNLTCELDVTDCFGRRSSLRTITGSGTWEVRRLLISIRKHRGGLTEGRLQHLYLHLVTRPNHGHQWLASWWIGPPADMKGKIIWRRPGLSL